MNYIEPPGTKLTVIVGSSGDRGCPRCGKKMDDDNDQPCIVDTRGRYWCIACTGNALGNIARQVDERDTSKYLWHWPLHPMKFGDNTDMSVRVGAAIQAGVVYRNARDYPPYWCRTMPVTMADLYDQASISFAEIDMLLLKGYVMPITQREFTRLAWTYEGRKKHLSITLWDSAAWKRSYLDRSCCAKALPLSGCVCEFRTICSDHGGQCHGTHD